MTDRLFVYGTLAPGRPNAHILAGVPGTWQRAIVHGRLYREGWGARQGYPGIRIDDSGDPVEGYVFSSDALAGEWERLDRFEGDEYERVSAKAWLKDGQTVATYVYQLRS